MCVLKKTAVLFGNMLPAESCTVEELEEMGADPGSIDVELAAAKLSLAAGHLASVERELTALRIIR